MTTENFDLSGLTLGNGLTLGGAGSPEAAHRAAEATGGAAETAPDNRSLEERILGGLDAEQREVASTLHGPVCVLAGAGTGKTRAITHRIAYGVHSGVYSPQRLLAVTFTARAAAEMRSRLRDLGVGNVQARTFHAAALRQLQFFWPQAVGGALPNLLDHKAQMIAEAARRLRLSTDRASIRDLASEIEWAKVSMLTPANYLENAHDRGNPGGFDLTAVARVFQSYEDVKTDRNVIDFEDVLLITVGILQEDPKVAATVREQYRHFVVDEYQDVSPLQQRLLELWLGGRDELCVVGDASQTIYSFTGASPKHLLGFKGMYPEAQVIKLIRDYRSTPQVVRLANELLAGRRSGGPAADAAWAAPLQLVAQRPAGPAPQFTECSDDEAEAATVAARVRELLDAGTKASQIAVLFRTNGQSEAYEQALAVRRHRLPAARRRAVLRPQRGPGRNPPAPLGDPGRRGNRGRGTLGADGAGHRDLPRVHATQPRTAAAPSANDGNRWPPSWHSRTSSRPAGARNSPCRISSTNFRSVPSRSTHPRSRA